MWNGWCHCRGVGIPPSALGACAGCKQPLGYGRYLKCMGKNWHPDCFRCKTCNKAITEREVNAFSSTSNLISIYSIECNMEELIFRSSLAEH